MCDEDGVGVDTGAADESGAAAATLAERYASIGTDFQCETTSLSENSAEMPVVSGVLEYAAELVGQLTRLQANTNALGAAARAGAEVARRADDEVGIGLATVFAA